MSPIRIAGGRGPDKAALARQLQTLGAVLILGGKPARRDGATVLVGAIRETLSTPGRGPIVRSRASRKGSFIPHRVSLRGDPPAPDLGELRRTIGADDKGKVTHVGSPLPQAPALEFTLGRPFMRPSLLGALGAMTRAAVAALKQESRRRVRRRRR